MTYDTYLPAVPINSVMRGLGVGTVVSSQSAKFKAGDKVQAMTGWQEMALLNEKEVTRVHLPAGVTLTDHLSMSLTGLTAMVGIYKVGKGEFKKGGTVLVSGAAGSTGGFAGQVYRNALGCRVVGTAGGPEKCRLVESGLFCSSTTLILTASSNQIRQGSPRIRRMRRLQGKGLGKEAPSCLQRRNRGVL
jgi:NADPH-dependent curcumin reductase CurA